MFPINGIQAQATDFRDAADRVLDRKDEAAWLEENGYAALEMTNIQALLGVPGFRFDLTVPADEPAVHYAHEVSGRVYETRTLQVWMVDTTKEGTAGFHTVTLFGNFNKELGAMVELEGWDEPITLGDALETSEYLAEQALKYTVTGGNSNLLPY